MIRVKEQDAAPLGKDVISDLFTAIQMDQGSKDPVSFGTFASIGIKEEEVPFGIGLVLKRIDAMKLPISFTLGGILTFGIIPDRAAAAVIMLIDLLEEYKGKTVTVEDVFTAYPYGFYKEESMLARADAIKADCALDPADRKMEFSYVYAV